MTMVHLPAVNTPQIEWCATTLDRHPRPVAPIYQPEIPAKYILEAALDGRRSKTLGSWNKMLVLMDNLFPGFGNQYAALAAWDGQLTDEPLQPDRPSNLHEPADAERDYGARGTFDDQAGGFMDPNFWRTLPGTAEVFVRALGRTMAEKRQVTAAKWRVRAARVGR